MIIARAACFPFTRWRSIISLDTVTQLSDSIEKQTSVHILETIITLYIYTYIHTYIHTYINR